MSSIDIHLSPVEGPLQYLRATLQVSRLNKFNPRMTAYMAHRTEIATAPSEGPTEEWVSLSCVSPYLICAVVGAEDPVFFRHSGFWWNQVKIVLLRSLIYRDPIRGVSTITQQLARNLYLSPQRSLMRKAAEAFLTWRLESRLSKQRILELYLNVVEWGRGVWGLAAAARSLCARSPQDLDPFQSIVLASLLPAPTVPLAGANAKRAFSVQRRLPPFLYAVGLLSLAQEQEVQKSVTNLEQILRQGGTLADGLRNVDPGYWPTLEAGRAKPTVSDLLAGDCGWFERIRFETFLSNVRAGLASYADRPMWWADAPRPGQLGEANG